MIGGVEVDKVDSSCWVYVIESIVNNRLYIGCTNNIDERLKRHNYGRVRSTKKDRPYMLVYSEQHGCLSNARKKELYLKSFKNPSYLRQYIGAVSSVGRAPDF